jgi:hypothetical protein
MPSQKASSSDASKASYLLLKAKPTGPVVPLKTAPSPGISIDRLPTFRIEDQRLKIDNSYTPDALPSEERFF